MAYRLEELPLEIRERLEAASRGETTTEYPAMPLEGTGGKWFMLVAGLVLGLAPSLYILDHRRMLPFDEMTGCTLVSFLGMWLTASALGRLHRFYSASVRPVAVIGPDSLATYSVRGGPVEVTALADIERIEIQTRRGMVRIRVKDLPPVELFPIVGGVAFSSFFQELKNRAEALRHRPPPDDAPETWQAAAERSGATFPPGWSPPWRMGLHGKVLAAGAALAAATIFLSWRQCALYVAVHRFERARQEDTTQSWRRWLKLAMRSSSVLAPGERLPSSVTGTWAYGRDFTHPVLATTPFEENLETALARYDELSFQEALESGEAAPLRKYLEDFPEPAHREPAEAALRELYEQAEARYLEGATAKGVKVAAREGMQALLRALAENHLEETKVGVAFLPVAGVEGGAIEAAVKATTGARTVHPVGPSFTKEANEARHSKIVASLNSGLQQVVGDLFELEERPLDAPGPRILVGYEVQFSGNHFFSKSQAEKPMSERDLYVGIVVRFICSIQTPPPDVVASRDPDDGHPVAILAKPAMDFRVYGRSGRPMERRVYDRMAQTAFEEFSRRIARTYGIAALGGSSSSG